MTSLPGSTPFDGSDGVSLGVTSKQLALQHAVATFIRDEVIPREDVLYESARISWDLIQDLRHRAQQAGIFGPQIHPAYGGLGLDWRTCAVLFEEAGTSLLGPLALHCAAPDEGNIHLLHEIASPEQRQRYLAPLARGELVSCFAMTEPAPGAGSDPTMLRSRGVQEGTSWVLNGEKWFITGGAQAAFAIVMVRTSDEADPRWGATMFLVPTDTPDSMWCAPFALWTTWGSTEAMPRYGSMECEYLHGGSLVKWAGDFNTLRCDLSPLASLTACAGWAWHAAPLRLPRDMPRSGPVRGRH